MTFTQQQKDQLINKLETARNNALFVYDALAKDDGSDNGTLNALNSITGGLNNILEFVKDLPPVQPPP